MKKAIYTIIGLFALMAMASACGGNSYAKRLKKEKRLIQNFLNENDVKVIDKYPVGRAFNENEYFYDSKTGVYFNVIDSGLGEKAEKYKQNISRATRVIMRFDSLRYLDNDTTFYSTETVTASGPVMLDYGIASTYTGSSSNEEILGLSSACTVPLQYVREGAIVKLITPFNEGSLASQQAYLPMYYNELKYVQFE